MAVKRLSVSKLKRSDGKSNDRATVVIGQSAGYLVCCLENEPAREFLAMERSGVFKEEHLRTGKLYLGVIEGEVNDGLVMAG